MKLYIMRHGHSPTTAEAGVSRDYDRPLSAEGKAAVQRVAAYLNSQGAKPALILHSPLVRATQTAQTVGAALKPSPKAQVFEPLSNVLPPDQLLEKLKPELEAAGELLAVGHQPQIGELAMVLASQVFDFKPGGVAALELSGASVKVLWSCNPQDLPAR